ncbi:MAG: TldD/PmbA family protein [Deltaproteobacteria bacterium]|nr:TldD/PmbA family protein [Deltaproteobacteria bacterium]
MPRFLAGCGPKAAMPAAAAQLAQGGFFQSAFGIDEAMIRRVLSELTARGADGGELYFQHATGSSVSLEDGIISKASSSVDLGVGLRVVIGDQVGYAYTEDLTEEAMLAAARTAAAIASGSALVAPTAFRRPPVPSYYPIEVPWSEVGIAGKLPLIERAAALAKAGDPAIDKVSVYWGDGADTVMIADIQGRIVEDYRPMTRLWVNTVARRGTEVQANGSNVAGRRGFEWYDDALLQEVASQAVDRTMRLFDARRPPAGEMPVVLAAGASGILLHEAVGHGLEADFNRKGTSIFADMMGKSVSSEHVTIVDNGVLPHERGSINVDDEGNPTQRTVLVENGVLKSYLHDSISARHYGVESTGSGRRESFRHAPLPRMRATYMENGPHTPEEVIAAVDHGIIAETFTNGQVQIGAGDFTFYIKNGWLIEGGKVTAPIKDINIIGNGPEALRKITMVANDFKLDSGGWTCGKDGQGVPVSQGLPTVLVSSMTVGGENA